MFMIYVTYMFMIYVMICCDICYMIMQLNQIGSLLFPDIELGQVTEVDNNGYSPDGRTTAAVSGISASAVSARCKYYHCTITYQHI